jgi:hypothetical protein
MEIKEAQKEIAELKKQINGLIADNLYLKNRLFEVSYLLRKKYEK